MPLLWGALMMRLLTTAAPSSCSARQQMQPCGATERLPTWPRAGEAAVMGD